MNKSFFIFGTYMVAAILRWVRSLGQSEHIFGQTAPPLPQCPSDTGFQVTRHQLERRPPCVSAYYAMASKREHSAFSFPIWRSFFLEVCDGWSDFLSMFRRGGVGLLTFDLALRKMLEYPGTGL